MRHKSKAGYIVYPVFFICVVWLAVIIAPCFEASGDLFAKLNSLSVFLSQPFNLSWTPNTVKYIGVLSGVYWLTVLYLWATKRKTRNGEEHGSAELGDVKSLNRRYAARKPDSNVILTANFRIGLTNMFKHQRNLHVMVVGGSGAGKTRYYVKPNLLQANSSFIATDPKGELLEATGGYLQSKGYEVRVFDLISRETSMCYNPFAYFSEDEDVLVLITNFIKNTTPKNANFNDPFWEKAETALLQSLMLYLWHEAPESEQSFEMIAEMLRFMPQDENGLTMNPVDILYEELRSKDPEHIALKGYDLFKTAPAKTASSVIMSAGVRLSPFILPKIARITSHDEMDFLSIGTKKVALFLVVPDVDKSFNFIISMMYTQIFQQLIYLANKSKKRKLPIPVHCLMDEFANIALPEAFENVLSVGRSRGISLSIILQNVSQIKALFEKQWESIIGNCDAFLYLGGNEDSTHELVSKRLGKETIDTSTYSTQRGSRGHTSVNYQRTGRDLMTPDEVRRMPRNLAALFVSGERPVIDEKYNLLKHPAIKDTSDGGAPEFVYSQGVARMAANGLRPEDYDVLDWDEDFPSLELENDNPPASPPEQSKPTKKPRYPR